MLDDSLLPRIQTHINRFQEIETLLGDPEVAADQARFVKLTKEYKHLRRLVDLMKHYDDEVGNIAFYEEVLAEETDAENIASAKDGLTASRAEADRLTEEVKLFLVPNDPEDDKNAILEIRAGTGGDEAALFAGDLAKMYMKFCEAKGWNVAVTSTSEGAAGGYKEIVMSVSGDGVYGILKYESGVHRVQRVPETESGGRIHTSTISVAVMPEVDDDIDIVIEDKDIRIDVMRASGNGGQCVNTTDSAVRLTHYPTGIVVYSQTEKSQLQNKAKAFALLKAKLYDIEQQQRHDAEAEMRRSQIGTGDRSEKIRTYNFPQGRVTDHRINLTIYKLDKVMNGDIQEIIDSLIAADQAAKLAKMNEGA